MRKRTDLAKVKRPYPASRTAGLRKGKAALPRTSTEALARTYTEPPLTDTRALQFVKMLHAGVPAHLAIRYFAIEYYDRATPTQIVTWVKRWLGAKLTREAQDAFNGGAWEALSKDRRLQVALDKHFAELAYWLYRTDFGAVADDDLRKTTDARTALMAKLQADRVGDPDSPFVKFMADLVAGKIKADAPPKLGEPVVPLPRTVRTAES